MYVNTEYLLRDFRLILRNCVFYNGPPSENTFSAVTYSRSCLALAVSFYERYFKTFLNINVPTRPHSSMLPQFGTPNIKPIVPTSSNASSPKISATEIKSNATSPLNLPSSALPSNNSISKPINNTPVISSISTKPAASPPNQSPPTFLSTSSSIAGLNNVNRTATSISPNSSSSSFLKASQNIAKPIVHSIENHPNNSLKLLSPPKDNTLSGPVMSPNSSSITSPPPNFTIKLSKIPKKTDPMILSGTTIVNKPKKESEISIQPKTSDVSKNITEVAKNNNVTIKKDELFKKVESKKETDLPIKKIKDSSSIEKVTIKEKESIIVDKPKEVIKPKVTASSLIDEPPIEKILDKRKAEDQGDNPFKIKVYYLFYFNYSVV